MRVNLNNNWEMLHRPLTFTAEHVAEILRADDYIKAGNLPCDVHMPLIQEGIINDPVVADYCFDSEWIENKSWWMLSKFKVTKENLSSREGRLVIEALDLFADIFVNGVHIGCHESVHYPFEANVMDWLQEGENTLLVRLTAGPERISREDYEYIKDMICTEYDQNRGDRGEKARAMLRKPQYVYGWDWGPRIATVGIMKNAWLDFPADVAITRVHPVTLEVNPQAKMRFEVEFESLLPISTQEADVLVEVSYDGSTIWQEERNVLAVSGVNYVDFETVIPDAKLWWPNGAGEQPMYTVTATVSCKTAKVTCEPVRFGIRTVGLDLTKYGDNDRRFAVQVNGVSIYSKGGDWIPSDSIYARVDMHKYETLIRDAKECNFNMLRIWGGGNYERDEFYNLCDENGILIWHDFMFGCSAYPDDKEWFRQLVIKEIDYQTKRLRHHPSMALWCGNNENQWLFEDRMISGEKHTPSSGLIVYNKIAPAIIRANCPEIPYWHSSPYGGEMPNDNEVGDRHHWRDCTMSDNMEDRINPEAYDAVTSRFVSEYGYIGPCSEETIQKYYGDKPFTPGDAIWDLHNNTFEKATVPEGIRKHYIDPESLSKADYLQYARLVQGLMYGYSLEAIRFYPKNDGALFWMYNDTWGEVGWTIIDYYLDRKPSYYYVKRAFAHNKFILRYSEDKKTVRVLGVNDTAKDIQLELEYGYVSFDGTFDTAKETITIPAFSKEIVKEFPLPDKNMKQGVVFARGGDAPLAILRTGPFRDYDNAAGSVAIEKIEKDGDDYIVTLKSTGFTHAVSLNVPAAVHMSDAYFDMLPGDVCTIRVFDGVKNYKPEELAPIFLTP